MNGVPTQKKKDLFLSKIEPRPLAEVGGEVLKV